MEREKRMDESPVLSWRGRNSKEKRKGKSEGGCKKKQEEIEGIG